ncbi:MAG: DUF2461 domain-containing protein [Thermoplasmatota archaeon]
MTYFTDSGFRFLEDLARNNDRDWFKANQDDFEAHLRSPSLAFIEDVAAWFEMEGLPYVAEAKKVGGSLSRIQRDVRFSKDKTPYHGHLTIHFRHRDGSKDQPAPAIGIRFGPDDIGMGGGLYGAQTPTLNTVRDAIVADPKGWQAATKGLELWGESLKTAPKGYDKEHPLIEDLRRKQFMASAPMDRATFTGDLMPAFQAGVARLTPFNDFLHRALVR